MFTEHLMDVRYRSEGRSVAAGGDRWMCKTGARGDGFANAQQSLRDATDHRGIVREVLGGAQQLRACIAHATARENHARKQYAGMGVARLLAQRGLQVTLGQRQVAPGQGRLRGLPG